MKRLIGVWCLWILGQVAFGQVAPEDSYAILLFPDTVRIKDYYEAHDQGGQSFSYLNSRQIDRTYFGQEPSYLLSSTPGITVVSDAGSYSGYSYFRIRGIDQTRISMTWDGVPLNEPEDQGVYFNNYPDFLNSMQKVEIHRGVGVGNLGVASFGGSIHLTSMNPYNPNSFKVGGNFGSFGTWRLYEEVNRMLKNNFGLYARATVQHSNGFKDRSANTSGSALVSANYIKGRNSIKLNMMAGQQSNQMAWLGVPLDTLISKPTFNANAEENDKFMQVHSQLHFKRSFGQNWLKAILFTNYLDGGYDFDLNNFLGLPSTKELYNYHFESNWYGAMAQGHYQQGIFSGTGGISASSYNRQHTGTEAALGELYRNTGIKQELSTYAKTLWNFNAFYLELDGQIRQAQLTYRGNVPWEGKNWTLPNYRGSVTHRVRRFIGPINGIFCYYSFGSSMREPSRLDLFYGNDDLLADSLGLPVVADIVPEQVFDHELGLRIRATKWSVNANLYRMQFRNEIALNGQFSPSGLPLHSNVARTRRSGLEIEAQWNASKNIALTHQSSFSQNLTKEAGESFQPVLTPSLIINQGIQWTQGKLTFGFNARYQSESYLDLSNTAKLPAFLTLDAFGGYETRKLRLGLRGMNLTNAQYYAGGYIGLDGTPLYFIQAKANGMATAEFRF